MRIHVTTKQQRCTGVQLVYVCMSACRLRAVCNVFLLLVVCSCRSGEWSRRAASASVGYGIPRRLHAERQIAAVTLWTVRKCSSSRGLFRPERDFFSDVVITCVLCFGGKKTGTYWSLTFNDNFFSCIPFSLLFSLFLFHLLSASKCNQRI